MKAKGDYQDRIHSDQMVLVIVKQVGWTAWAVAKGNSGGGGAAHQAQVRSDQMVLVMPSQRGWITWAVAKDTQS